MVSKSCPHQSSIESDSFFPMPWSCPAAHPQGWVTPALPKELPAWQSLGSNPTVPYTCCTISPKLTIPLPFAPDEESKAENARPVPTCTLSQVPPAFLWRLTWSWHRWWGHHELVGKEMLRSWHHPHTQCSAGHPWDRRMGTRAWGSCDAHRVGCAAGSTRWPGRGQREKTAEHL